MFALTAIFCLSLCFLCTADPVELIPVDEGVEDRTVLSESLKVEQKDMRKSQSFEQLFRVKGSPEIFVRRAGSLHAVFRNPHYLETSEGSIPLVPTGTIYCIGEVTQEVLEQLGVMVSGTHDSNIDTDHPQDDVQWNPVAPGISHASTSIIRFLDDEGYRRRRLATFVLEVSMN